MEAAKLSIFKLIVSFYGFSNLFIKWGILKMRDIVDIQNCLLSHSFLNNNLPKSFEIFSPKCSDIHSTPTRSSMPEYSYMSHFRGAKYGVNSNTDICICSWSSGTQAPDSPSKFQIGEIKERGCLTIILITTNFLYYLLIVY